MGVAEKHFPFPIQACTAMLDGMHVRANAYESTHQSEPIHTLAEFHRETLLASLRRICVRSMRLQGLLQMALILQIGMNCGPLKSQTSGYAA